MLAAKRWMPSPNAPEVPLRWTLEDGTFASLTNR
jgi:hypothetical protein